MLLSWFVLPLLVAAAPNRCRPRPQVPLKPSQPDTFEPKYSSTGKKTVLYFSNWGVYAANYTPAAIPAKEVTHLLYGFAQINENGTVTPSDPYTDLQARFPSSPSKRDSSSSNVYGSAIELFKLKVANRHLKTLWSVGGGKTEQAKLFSKVASTDSGRKLFASSVVSLVSDYGLDGIDLDWEYPEGQEDPNNFVSLLKTTREALDKYAQDNSQDYHYLLTVAAPGGPDHYGNLLLGQMDKYVDSWHLMAYDYSGGWDKKTGHQANVYPNTDSPDTTPFNTNEAIDDYTSAGVGSNKLVLGVPLYGRSFGKTDGMGASFDGVGNFKTTDPGVIPYRQLPLQGSKETVDKALLAAYSYDSKSKMLVSYETPDSAKLKVKYVGDRSLGGVAFWEASGDKNDDDSLVRVVAKSLDALDGSENMLSYPKSPYDNIRNGKGSS